MDERVGAAIAWSGDVAVCYLEMEELQRGAPERSWSWTRGRSIWATVKTSRAGAASQSYQRALSLAHFLARSLPARPLVEEADATATGASSAPRLAHFTPELSSFNWPPVPPSHWQLVLFWRNVASPNTTAAASKEIKGPPLPHPPASHTHTHTRYDDVRHVFT